MGNCNGCHDDRHAGYCVECEAQAPGQMARNHYFTGKLLVERDFVEEQRYHIGKVRRHNKYLHGWGTVCGLKVKQHTNPACRSQYVLVEPGVAVDCCGREILVEHEQTVDFRDLFLEAWRKKFGKNSAPDDAAHRFQLRLCYTECPTEEVPALFEDCGCDDSGSQPNRILESFQFEVSLDPERPTPEPPGVRFEWLFPLAVAHARRVLVDPAKGRIYVLNAEDPGSLFAFSSDYTLLSGHTLDAQGFDLAVNADGSRLYVATAAADTPVLVLDTEALGTTAAQINALPLDGAAGEPVYLAASPNDGRLYTLTTANNQVNAWSSAIDANLANPEDAREGQATAGAETRAIAVEPEGGRIFVGNRGDGSISIFQTSDMSVTSLTTPGLAPDLLGLAVTTAGLRLFIGDSTNRSVQIYASGLGGTFSALGDPTSLGSATPVSLVPSPGGRWLYVLLDDGAAEGGRLVALDSHDLENNTPPLTAELPVGTAPAGLALASDGRRIYAAYTGDLEAESDGGVAVIEIHETDCDHLFEQSIEGCPVCSDECLVLATVEEYVYSDPVDDEDLDNIADRRLLPSTTQLYEVLQCLLESGGKDGEPGEQGPPGDPGEGIDDVEVEFIDCELPGSASLDESGGQRILKLEIPRGCNGEPGGPGAPGAPGPGIDDVTAEFVPCDQPGSAKLVEAGGQRIIELVIPSGCAEDQTPLTHICAINWEHAGQMSTADFQEIGLLIAFDQLVLAETIHDQSFRLMCATQDAQGNFECWCEVRPKLIIGVELALEPGENGTCKIGDIVDERPAGPVNGARFIPDFPEGFNRERPIRVILEGDLVADEKGRGVDADHLPFWLPNRRTGNETEGGTFLSWFHLG